MRKREPLVLRRAESKGGTGPLDWPKSDHHAAPGEGVQALVEGVAAHAVVDHLDAPAAGQALHLGGEVLLGVEDHLVRSGLAGDPRLLLRRDRADHPGAAELGDLAEELAHAAGRGVDQAGVPGLQRIGAAGEVVGRHALEHGGGALPGGHSFGQLHQPRRRHGRQLGVGPLDAGVGDPVAHGHLGDPGAHGHHGPRRLLAGGEGQRRAL